MTKLFFVVLTAWNKIIQKLCDKWRHVYVKVLLQAVAS